MEWLGLLLLYLISAYMKKRNQDTKRRKIESAPDWDPPQDHQPERPPRQPKTNLDQLLMDMFEGAVKVESEVPPMEDVEAEYSDEDLIEDQAYQAPVHVEEHSSHIDDQLKAFEEKIYHSKLGDRKELKFGKKWAKKNRLRSELFESKKSLKKAIILKEVLDKPLALRK